MKAIDLAERVAIVTGGVSGIGAAIAADLGEAGAKVTVVDRRDPGEADLSAVVSGPEIEIDFVRAEVASFAESRRVVEEILAKRGRIDFLINNAGIARDAAVWNMTEEAWDDVIDVDLKGCFNYAGAVAGPMREQRRGRIVNVSSINGLRGKFGQANYAAAKAGVIGLTKTLARELGPSGVTVNAVAPGLVRTAMTEKLDAKILNAARDESVLGKIAHPRDIAGVVTFLCSDWAAHITGEVIRIDGGQYI